MIPEPGDVLHILDRAVNPPKHKFLICIDPSKQFFFRINSKPIFKPHHQILASDYGFLNHDSYVELRGFVRPYAYDIEISSRVGRLTRQQRQELIAAAEAAKTLSQEQKDLIRRNMT